MERLASASLPSGFGYEWTGTVYQQRRAEGREGLIFGLSSVLVLLLLAALYESWSMLYVVVAGLGERWRGGSERAVISEPRPSPSTP